MKFKFQVPKSKFRVQNRNLSFVRLLDDVFLFFGAFSFEFIKVTKLIYLTCEIPFFV